MANRQTGDGSVRVIGRRQVKFPRTSGRKPGPLGMGGRVGLGAALILLVVFSQWPGPTPSNLVIEAELLAKLQTLADGLHKEVVLCLTGESERDTARADDFVMPAPRLSTTTRSSFDACPEGTLASWHNHPRALQGWRAASTTAWEARDARRLCVLSDTDIRTAERLRHPFIVVSVDARTWCWWSLAEVERFARESISPGPPAPDRLAGDERVAVWAQPRDGERRDSQD